jgi:hypothetical protein
MTFAITFSLGVVVVGLVIVACSVAALVIDGKEAKP